MTALTDPRAKEQIAARLQARVPHILFVLFRFVFFFGMVYVLLYPLLIMVSRAFRTVDDMLNPAIVWIPQHFTLENFTHAAKLMEYGQTMPLTARVTILSTLCTMVSTSMAGYALARYKVPLKKLMIVVILLTIIVPAQTYLIPIFFQFRFFDFFGFGSLIGLFTGQKLSINMSSNEVSYYIQAILGMGIRSGLHILVFYQFFRNMPQELEDAARIDGCGEAGTFVRVMLPNALAPFVVVFILSCVWYWNDTFYSTIMLRNTPMLANKLNNVKELLLAEFGGASRGDSVTETVVIFSAALLFILPPLIMYLIAQRFFIQSVERSGIVG